MGERVVLDVARRLAQRVELGQLVDRLRPLVDETGADVAERLLQVLVGERPARVLLEGGRGDFHQSSFASPIGAAVGHPGEHLGDVPARHRAALPLQLAGDVQQAAEIAGEHGAGTRCRDRRRLALDHVVGDLGVLDAERAAEAAAGFRVLHFGERQPVDRSEQPARLVAHPHLAQARAGVVVGDGSRERRRRPAPRRARRPGSSRSRGPCRRTPAPGRPSPLRRRAVRDSAPSASPRTTPTAPPRSRRARTRRSSASRARWRRGGRRSCRRAGRSTSAPPAPRPGSRRPAGA